MIPTKTRKAHVDLAKVVEDYSRNVREYETDELAKASYDDPGMRESMKLIGQQATVKLEQIGDKFFILQGNRRIHNMKVLASEGAIDPRTVKLNDKGEKIEGSGKPFSSVEAEIYDELDEATRLALIVDHGSMRSLNKVEMYTAMKRFFNAGYNEKNVAVLLFDLLKQHYPPTRKLKPPTEDKGQDILNNFKGVIQTAKTAWRSPEVLENAYILKLRGGQKWPTNAEMAEGYKVHDTEIKADKTGKISRKNPGPKFTEWWNKYTTKIEEAEAEGGSGSARPQSMMNRTTVEGLVPVSDSRILKLAFRIILREESQDNLPKLDKMLVDIESKFTPEQKALLDTMFTATVEEPSAKGPEKKAEEVK